MRILFLGDIFGAPGRNAVISQLKSLKKNHKLDFVIANGENSAGGFGINQSIYHQLLESGIDVVTTGNHVWDQSDIFAFAEDPKLLRPENYSPDAPGHGWGVYLLNDGRRVLVINVMCRLFMNPIDDPFAAVDRILAEWRLGQEVDAIVVDVHGEAATEKTALGFHLDGRVSLVAGTHTHVPTADHRILPAGSGYITDVGMCGVYDSVGGVDKLEPLNRFLTGVRGKRYVVAEGEASICGVAIKIDENGKTTNISPLRIGGDLEVCLPDFWFSS